MKTVRRAKHVTSIYRKIVTYKHTCTTTCHKNNRIKNLQISGGHYRADRGGGDRREGEREGNVSGSMQWTSGYRETTGL